MKTLGLFQFKAPKLNSSVRRGRVALMERAALPIVTPKSHYVPRGSASNVTQHQGILTWNLLLSFPLLEAHVRFVLLICL